MIIAGNCLYTAQDEQDDEYKIIDNAVALEQIGITFFRCKLWGGGTTLEKFNPGIGDDGVKTLEIINYTLLPAGTEIHIPAQVDLCKNLSYIWIGARNCRNFSLLEYMGNNFNGDILLKRAPDMTIDETIGLFDICSQKYNFMPWIIERGQINIDRLPDSRWSPDLKGVIRIKQERPDIFERIIIDCSHSVGRKEYIADTHKAFKAIGCNNFMFEATLDGMSATDARQMLSVDELNKIIN